MRSLLWAIVVVWGVAMATVRAASAEPAEARARMEAVHAAFLRAHCVRCHDADEANGGVRLDDVPLEMADLESAERWAKVLGVLNAGDMPPEDEPQPPAAAKEEFLETLSRQLVVARKALADAGGMITMRRLNRREYVNTIRDLLDVEVNARDLPADDDGGSFDTIGSGLFFSSDQFEQYLALGRAALDEAIAMRPRPAMKSGHVEPEDEVNKRVQQTFDQMTVDLDKVAAWQASGKPASEFGFDDEREAALKRQAARERLPTWGAYLADPATKTGVMLQAFVTVTGQLQIRVPGRDAGTYLLRARVGVPDADHAPPRFIEYGLLDRGLPGGEMRILGCVRVPGSLEKPEVIEVPITLTGNGTRAIGLRERRHNSSDAMVSQFHDRRKQDAANVGYRADIWLDWIEWEGPVVEQWPPRSHALVLGGIELSAKPDENDARRVIERFAERAFRGRPVTPAFVDRLVGHYAAERNAGKPFLEAIKTPLAIVLASPGFLYLAESVRGKAGSEGGSGRIALTDVELANRLAYFLCAGPPDERLMELARGGTLSEPAVLAREVDRLLVDERAKRFIAGFTHQWLHMTRLDFFQFNHQRYPDFDGSVKEAARREVYETLHDAIAADRPLRSMLESDHVVVNDLLADYYGIPGVSGPEFRRVRVPDGLPRGGLLGMTAILAMGSDGERSSPVERGAWVLRKLLHDPPPPAPANVPQLSRFTGKQLSARDLMTAHQEQPQCAQCHRTIDPIGYGLENFDAVGRWRTEERIEPLRPSRLAKPAIFPIDAAGVLPDGTRFDGFRELRGAIATHHEAFARGFTEHLIEFALGRPCGFSDDEYVASILSTAKPSEFTPRAIIHALVASPQFRSK